MRSASLSRDSPSCTTPTSATKRPRTSGDLTKGVYVDKVMTFDSDTHKDGVIPILESVIKSEHSDEASKHTVKETTVERSSRLQFLNESKSSTNELSENLFKLEEIGFSVEIVRKHIAMREEVEKLREQFEEVKGEICKHITEKAELERHFEAMKEAKDQQIASLKLKRIVLEEDIAGVERDFQTSAASLGLTGNNCVVEGSMNPGSWESNRQWSMKTGKEVLKCEGRRPRNLDGFVLPCNVPEKRKRREVLESDAEYSLPRSHKRTKQEKDVPEELIGSLVNVWWPDDQQYYEGIIESYNPAKKKHKVVYLDGDVENLMLKKEQWLLVDEPSDCRQVSDRSESTKDEEHEKPV